MRRDPAWEEPKPPPDGTPPGGPPPGEDVKSLRRAWWWTRWTWDQQKGESTKKGGEEVRTPHLVRRAHLPPPKTTSGDPAWYIEDRIYQPKDTSKTVWWTPAQGHIEDNVAEDQGPPHGQRPRPSPRPYRWVTEDQAQGHIITTADDQAWWTHRKTRRRRPSPKAASKTTVSSKT